ncbi:MAG: multicopper oxidase family protein [Minisyncoccia bacterium]
MKNKLILGVIVVVIVIGGIVALQQTGTDSKVMIGTFSTDISGLTEAEVSETVELKNGDSYDLTASVVKKRIGNAEVKMLAYNGSIPGPLIKVPQGAEITINFKNETDVPTTLHSHGVRLQNQFDGVPDVTQQEVPVGGSFTYKIRFDDTGMFWYHPHVREDYAQESGLYGNYLVTPKDPSYWSPVDREVALFLDDVLIENGALAPFDTKMVNRTLMGRFGNVMLINGETNYSLQVKKGEVVRFYATNAANARPFNFAINGTRMKLVGNDSGGYEKDQWTDAVFIGPSERAVVEVFFDKAGTYALESKTPDKSYTLGKVTVSAEPVSSANPVLFSTLKTRKEVMRSMDLLRPYFAREPDKRLSLSLEMSAEMQNMVGGAMSGMGGMAGMENMPAAASSLPEGGIEWEEGDSAMMNSMSTAENVKWNMIDEATGKKNMDINWKFARGIPVKIRITNDAKSMHPMQHPIHFHGQRFLVINKNGIAQTNLAWEDTFTIPAGEYADIVLDTSNPGTWLAHCHIPEHMEAGMMMKFEVQ